MAKLNPAADAAETTSIVEGQINGTAPVDPAASTAAEKKLSPKNKITRGVPADWKTTWVDANFSPEAHMRLTKVASQRDTTVLKLLQTVLAYGLDAYQAQFDADVVAFDASPKKVKAPSTGRSAKKIADMTEDELEKAAQSAQQRAEAAAKSAQEMLAAAKARRLAAQAAAAGAPAE